MTSVLQMFFTFKKDHNPMTGMGKVTLNIVYTWDIRKEPNVTIYIIGEDFSIQMYAIYKCTIPGMAACF